MSECRYCGGECETSDEYMCDGYAGDIDNLYGDDDDEGTARIADPRYREDRSY